MFNDADFKPHLNNQLFIWDFNKSTPANERMLGLTYSRGLNKKEAGHWQDDSQSSSSIDYYLNDKEKLNFNHKYNNIDLFVTNILKTENNKEDIVESLLDFDYIKAIEIINNKKLNSDKIISLVSKYMKTKINIMANRGNIEQYAITIKMLKEKLPEALDVINEDISAYINYKLNNVSLKQSKTPLKDLKVYIKKLSECLCFFDVKRCMSESSDQYIIELESKMIVHKDVRDLIDISLKNKDLNVGKDISIPILKIMVTAHKQNYSEWISPYI